MSPPSVPNSSTALVLGGGGSTGNAWLIGVVAGLYDAGVDVSAADVTVGTSAGATAAAQLAGATPDVLYAAVLTAPVPPARPSMGSAADQIARISAIGAASQDAADMRRRMGAAALEREEASDGSWSTTWRATVAPRLTTQTWPARTVLLTAIDAHTGEGLAFDSSSGVDLVDAVAASCSSGLPYRIGDRAFLDGGYRRNENADLAAGCGTVLVLSPLGGRTLHPLEWGLQLAAQVEELEAGGSTVVTVVPDSSAEHLFGANAMDLSLRPAAARAGYSQGTALAELWG